MINSWSLSLIPFSPTSTVTSGRVVDMYNILAHFQLVKLMMLQHSLVSPCTVLVFKGTIHLYVPHSQVMWCWSSSRWFLCPDTLGSHVTPFRLCLVIPLLLQMCVMTLNGSVSWTVALWQCSLATLLYERQCQAVKRARSFVKVVCLLNAVDFIDVPLSPSFSPSLLLFAQKYAGWPWFKFNSSTQAVY